MQFSQKKLVEDVFKSYLYNWVWFWVPPIALKVLSHCSPISVTK